MSLLEKVKMNKLEGGMSTAAAGRCYGINTLICFTSKNKDKTSVAPPSMCKLS
jgi:hypothetical protein